MMCRPLAHKHLAFLGMLAALLVWASAAEAIGQTPPYAGGFAPGAATGATLVPGANMLPQPTPPLVAVQPPRYAQPALGPQNNGALSYSAQPLSAMQPPGYVPLPPPAQNNFAPPFSPPPNWQPAYPYLPVQPGGYPIDTVPPQPVRPRLPQMVYAVTSKFWIRPDALLWTTKAAPLPQAIATTGSVTDAIPGALGQPGTQTVIGGGHANLGYIGGIRIESGVWLDERRVYGLEAGYFALILQSRTLSDQSDPYGNPVIARPVIDAQSGVEGSYLDAAPGNLIGRITVILRSEFQGANFDGDLNLVQTDHVRLDGLLGFRYLSLSESLSISDQYASISGGTLSFGGAAVNASDMLSDFDRYKVTNSFYGGSGGARLYFAQERWILSALGKVALGTTQQRATVSGSTTLTEQNGNQTTLPGGILATTGNMVRRYQSPFAVAPEGHLNIGYLITPRVTMRIGYSFIYLSNVARPGNQMNRVTSANLIPSDPAYGAAGPNLPAFQFHTSSYWAQGLNFGVDSRF